MSRVRPVSRPSLHARLADDAGNAIVEFIVVGVLVIVPLVYVVVTVMTVQAAASASAAAAREAARAFTTADNAVAGQARAQQAAEVAFVDHGFTLPAGALRLSCGGAACLAPGGTVHVDIDWQVPLPWVPAGLSSTVALPIATDHDAPVDTYRVDS